MIQIKNRWNGVAILEVDSANLRGANLCGANLRGANLCGANLRGADLRDADLCGANLRGADLRDADLCDANLRGANLRDANLCGANLRGANLCGANLRGANLRGANLRDAKNAPIVITGMRWVVQISGTGWMQIGCQKHSVSEWMAFNDDRISNMSDGALDFWNANREMLISLCEQWKHPEE